jgi:virulence-associated protein VapD
MATSFKELSPFNDLRHLMMKYRFHHENRSMYLSKNSEQIDFHFICEMRISTGTKPTICDGFRC